MSTRYVARHRAAGGGLSRCRPLARDPRRALVVGVLLASAGVVASLAPAAVAEPAPSDPVIAAGPAYEDPSEQGDYTLPRPVAQPSSGPGASEEPEPEPVTRDPSSAPSASEDPAPSPATREPSSAPSISEEPAPASSPASREPSSPPSTEQASTEQASTQRAPTVPAPAKPPATSRPAKKTRASTPAAPQKATAKPRMAGTGVVSIASSLSGISYVWGGTTPRGFDCSGYTRYVYRKAGISLPRTAAQQQRATKRVSNPRPGDLVFFGRPAHHVGIYAGNGKMYDAPRRGRSTGLHTIWSSNVSYGRAR